ncbi:MAG: hypothetical protein NTW19_09650 [Planctomycetota bacterium]|nr:hypothetical protein [Planctomycetota bacterium]
MKRSIFNFAALASLLIGLAAAVGWAVSVQHSVFIHFCTPKTDVLAFGCAAGGLAMEIGWASPEDDPHGYGLPEIRIDEGLFVEVFGGQLDYYKGHALICSAGFIITPGLGGDGTFLMVPFWFVILASLPMPIAWFRAWRRRRRFGPGCCPACGYDLRGSPPGGDCPECGATAGNATSVSAYSKGAP